MHRRIRPRQGRRRQAPGRRRRRRLPNPRFGELKPHTKPVFASFRQFLHRRRRGGMSGERNVMTKSISFLCMVTCSHEASFGHFVRFVVAVGGAECLENKT